MHPMFSQEGALVMPHILVVYLIGAGLFFGLAVAGVNPASATHDAAAGPFEKAICYVFGGREDCRTVRIFDAEECIIKIHPMPLPDLDPSVSACLRDEVQTKKLYLRKARPRNMIVSDRVNVTGRDVVEVLVRYDDNGAAVWESRNADTFELKGDPVRTRKAIRKFSSEFCVGPSRMVGGGTSGGIIGAKEAYRRAAEGSITLVDIRLPSEWRRTGVGINAIAITMHQGIYNFVDQLKKVDGGKDRPIALICAEGVRSAAMQKLLKQFGFKGVIDVHEGMEGSAEGPGWIKSGLPVTPYNPEQAELK
jgi:rhodanese-related sulfurtransferase